MPCPEAAQSAPHVPWGGRDAALLCSIEASRRVSRDHGETRMARRAARASSREATLLIPNNKLSFSSSVSLEVPLLIPNNKLHARQESMRHGHMWRRP